MSQRCTDVSQKGDFKLKTWNLKPGPRDHASGPNLAYSTQVFFFPFTPKMGFKALNTWLAHGQGEGEASSAKGTHRATCRPSCWLINPGL